MRKTVSSIYQNGIGILDKIPADLLALVTRIAIWSVFWRSAQTKFSGGELLGQHWKFWDLNSTTLLLFEYEYRLPLISGEVAAHQATFAEFFLSMAVLLGLFTRLSALGLLIMTLTIQLFVYPDAWNVHILWAALLLYLMKHGSGNLSLDRVFFTTFFATK